MIKKLAIGAAAVLPALAFATGSAGASPATATDAGTAQQPDVVINEVGVGLVDAGPDFISGTFVELRNTTTETVSLNGWELRACDATGSFTVVTFGLSHSINPGVSEFFLIADDIYDFGTGGPPRDAALGADFDQDDGGLALLDDSPLPNRVHDVKWGSPAFACSSFVDAGATPDDDNSLQLNTAPPPTWCALPPTPKAVNGSC